jgi:hypothetical protein
MFPRTEAQMKLLMPEVPQDLATEELFREVNEKIVRLNEVFESPEGDFLCECANSMCAARLRVTLWEYDAIRSDPRRFLMAPGHERPGSRVIERRYGYEVVETDVVRPRPELTLVYH